MINLIDLTKLSISKLTNHIVTEEELCIIQGDIDNIVDETEYYNNY